ncbi:FAD:protein FMN transferase [Pseudomonas sp. 148P]|uniref:FAD:protein FMN transferase n=1 Tax=Pseudomonas ulcerans TaxID=3115852 RepID=A0ABU7HQK1_9PSED|nr:MULTISPECIES: FAD:protein FMN transferase [unclassified Pseudomonas]MEE1923750.1 FAD:protein FMN transferase [Pseudomonas sp. 147P]MEE1933810.1 FAD:protein FMN transferase [Pseudomonas sp. 148P]
MKAVLSILCALALVGCSKPDPVERVSGPTMGSTYTVQYVPPANGPDAVQVKQEIETILATLDQHFSTYRGDSLVSTFNQLPAGSCQAMPEDVLKLVRFGETLWRESGGAFDLSVEPLMNLWGFGPQSREQKVPDPQRLVEVRQRVGQGHLRIDGDLLCKDVALELDFDSLVAGHAVDLVSARLSALGIHNQLVEITGELKTLGRKPDGTPWRVALELPREDRQIAEQIVSVDGLGVSTSGDYRNYFEENGQRFSHTFDARLGRPIAHSLAAVTVFDASALVADGYSTLLLVLGPEQGWEFAVAQNLPAVFVMRADSGFIARVTPAFERIVGTGAGKNEE